MTGLERINVEHMSGKTEQQYLSAAGCRINGAAFFFYHQRKFTEI